MKYALLSILLITLVAKGQAAGQEGVFTDPAKTDADFALQGEYVAMTEVEGATIKIGIQVIALGKSQFQAAVHMGGLPGDGWDGEPPVRVNSEIRDGKIVFANDGGTGTLEDGKLTIRHPNDEEFAVAEKVDRKSPTLGAKPPENAVVLFDGTSVDGWENGRMTDGGLLMQGTTSKARFKDHSLHLEFRLPYQPEARGQGRGNSGLYVQGRYECQMLDSFGLTGEENECGGLYSVKKPDLNMCFPPLTWQTYDIDYTAARYGDEGKLVSNPRITVKHNGVVIHKDVELPGERNTTAAPVAAGPDAGPIYLQDHGNPVRYRNIWVVEK